MLKRRNVLTIFLASPSDLTAERIVVREVVQKINSIIGKPLNWHIDLLGWEDTLPGAGRPQELINTDVERCDLFLGMLWKKWGSKTGKYSSGFEEEFNIAIQRRRNGTEPQIWMCFKEIDEESKRDPGRQLKRVMKFRQEQIDNREVLFKEMSGSETFKQQVHDWLVTHLIELSRVEEKKSGETGIDLHGTMASSGQTSFVESSRCK